MSVRCTHVFWSQRARDLLSGGLLSNQVANGLLFGDGAHFPFFVGLPIAVPSAMPRWASRFPPPLYHDSPFLESLNFFLLLCFPFFPSYFHGFSFQILESRPKCGVAFLFLPQTKATRPFRLFRPSLAAPLLALFYEQRRWFFMKESSVPRRTFPPSTLLCFFFPTFSFQNHLLICKYLFQSTFFFPFSVFEKASGEVFLFEPPSVMLPVSIIRVNQRQQLYRDFRLVSVVFSIVHFRPRPPARAQFRGRMRNPPAPLFISSV